MFLSQKVLADEGTLLKMIQRHFPEAEVEAEVLTLSAEELKKVETASDSPLPGRVVHTRVVKQDGEITARLYLDRHRVRTLPETLGILLSKDGKVIEVEVLTFAEPAHYKPRPVWLKQFEGFTPGEAPRYKDSVDGITGATLTGRAVTKAVRRVLAIHALTSS